MTPSQPGRCARATTAAGARVGRPGRATCALLAILTLLAIVTLPVLGTATPAVARPAASGPRPAASYRLAAAVDLDTATVAVAETVQVRNVVGVPLESLVFHVVPNALGAYRPGPIRVDSQLVEGRLDGSILELPLASPLQPGATAEVSAEFTLTVPRGAGRLAASPRGITLGYWFLQLAVHREDWDRRQFVDVGDASFSEVADFDLTVTTSAPAHVVATGQRVEQERQRSRFVARGVRDLAVAAAPEYVVRRTVTGATTIEAAAFGTERAEFYTTRTAELADWLTARLGPFPYPTVVVADADLPASFGGLEYPGLVLLARGIGLPPDPAGSSLDSLLLHELLHQWFYAAVGNDQIADPWLDEALTTYVTYLYYREREPGLAPLVYSRTIAGGSVGPVNATVYDFPSDPPYFSQVYRRGAQFLQALHAELGDEAFWSLLRDHLATHRDRIAWPRAFLARAQAATTAPLAPLFAEYFDDPAFRATTPRNWRVEAPDGPWSGTATVFVGADFPVSRVQVWLDQRKLADGPANALTLNLADVEPGEYVLLVRVWDHDDALFEQTRRVEIAKEPAAGRRPAPAGSRS